MIYSSRIMLVSMHLFVAVSLRAQEPAAAPETSPSRFYEQTPYDEVTLKDKTVLKAEPLPFPDRRVPTNSKPTDKLVLRLSDRPEEEYEVLWRDVVGIRLFEQMVLSEAQRLATAGESEQAYDYFDFLEGSYPNMSGLPEAIQRYIYQDAQKWQRQRKYDYVLVLLNQLWTRNANYAGLDRALGIVTDKLVETRVAESDYRTARLLVTRLAEKFPNEPTVARWRQKLIAQAEDALANARDDLPAGRTRAAHDHALQAVLVWPKLQAAREFLVTAHREYPYLAVGVLQPYEGHAQSSLTSWSTLRAERLLKYAITEFAGNGAEGGTYVSPLGTMETRDLGVTVGLRLRPDVRWSDGAPLTGFDISRTLLDGGGDRDQPWRQLLERVQVEDVYSVDIRLKRAFVLPDALFQTEIARPAGSPAETGLRRFTLGERAGNSVQYLASANVSEGGAGSPKEIVEHQYPDGKSAIGALLRHEVSMIDRMNPWELGRLQKVDDVTIETYAVPTLHCLVPNMKKPLMANRGFRRSLVFAIHREAILKVQLLRNQEMVGARVVSGPFPTGYAYNSAVEIRPYEPRVAMLLASVAVQEIAEKQAAKGATTAQKPTESSVPTAPQPAQGPTPDVAEPAAPPAEGDPNEPTVQTTVKIPPLVIAHPVDEIATLACRAIARQLGLIKIPVTLAPLKPGETVPSGDYDLLYTELQVWEPVVDCGRLFGPGGLIPASSPYLQAALAQLDAATEWKAARESLQKIHAIVADEVSILPLFQLPEHFAYRKTISSIPGQPATLYQNVMGWKIDTDLPPEE